MSDELFSRLDAISRIVGGGNIATLDPELDPTEPAVEEHDHGTEQVNATSDFTGGTMTEAHGDSGGETPGARALQNMLLTKFAGGNDLGIYSDRDVRGRPGVRSVHGEGRAGDFGVPVVKGGHATGHAVADFLVANADRLGVQRLIFAGRSWNRRTRTWVAYNGVNPHLDHVHWEITPEAAGRVDLYGADKAAATTTPKGNTGDLLSRVSTIASLIGGKDTAPAASAKRAKAGYRDVTGEMAARFAKARSGKAVVGGIGSGSATNTAGAVAFDDGAKGQYQQYAVGLFTEFGWGAGEAGALIELWNRESGWNPGAQNPTSTAFGIAQFLNSTWAGTGFKKSSDPQTQIRAGLTYVKNRYGSPSRALAFWRANHWY